MKKIISIIIVSAVLICCASAGFSASAVVTVSDGTYEYTYNNESNSWTLYSYLGEGGDLTLPESYGGTKVTGINQECFMNSAVTSVTIPKGYTSIGNYAFYGCESLSTVSFPQTIGNIGMGAFAASGIENADLSETSIPYVSAYCFKSCKQLTSVKLPETAEFIAIEAFYGTGLTEIDIPKSVNEIGDGAFFNTEALEKVALHKGIKKIGTSSFENSGLKEINLPDGLEKIGDSAFRSAYDLSTLLIPSSVDYIGAYALYPMSVRGTIHAYCFEGTLADTYCYENFVRDYSTAKEIYGDVDKDGFVSIYDVTMLQQYLAEIVELDAENPLTMKLLDVNTDDALDADDALVIQKYVAQMYDELPIN